VVDHVTCKDVACKETDRKSSHTSTSDPSILPSWPCEIQQLEITNPICTSSTNVTGLSPASPFPFSEDSSPTCSTQSCDGTWEIIIPSVVGLPELRRLRFDWLSDSLVANAAASICPRHHSIYCAFQQVEFKTICAPLTRLNRHHLGTVWWNVSSLRSCYL
jgi:hypothetical protein